MLYLGFVCVYVLLSVGCFFKIKPKVYFTISMLTLGIYAFLFDPIAQWAVFGGHGMDSIRYYEMLDYFRAYGFNTELYEREPLSTIYLYLLSLLPGYSGTAVITFFITYGIPGILLIKIGKRNYYPDYIINIGLCLYIIFGDYLRAVNGVRYPVAIALFCLALYYDLFSKKKYKKLFYIFPFFMHTGSSLYIISRFVSTKKIKWTVLGVIIFFFIYQYFLDYILMIMHMVLDPLGLGLVVLGVEGKILSYATNDHVVYQQSLLTEIMMILVFIPWLAINTIAQFSLKNSLTTQEKVVLNSGWVLLLISLVCFVTGLSTGNIPGRIVSYANFPIAILGMRFIASKSQIWIWARLRKVIIYCLILYSFIYILILLLKHYPSWLFFNI